MSARKRKAIGSDASSFIFLYRVSESPRLFSSYSLCWFIAVPTVKVRGCCEYDSHFKKASRSPGAADRQSPPLQFAKSLDQHSFLTSARHVPNVQIDTFEDEQRFRFGGPTVAVAHSLSGDPSA
jgi:hypothetical protein